MQLHEDSRGIQEKGDTLEDALALVSSPGYIRANISSTDEFCGEINLWSEVKS